MIKNYPSGTYAYIYLIDRIQEVINVLGEIFDLQETKDGTYQVISHTKQNKIRNKRYIKVSELISGSIGEIVAKLSEIGYQCDGYQLIPNQVEKLKIFSAMVYFKKSEEKKQIRIKELEGCIDRLKSN